MTDATGHSAFTIDNTALVLIDHQIGTIGWAGELQADERDQLKMWTRVITRFAKSAGMPIVLTSSLETEAQGPPFPTSKRSTPTLTSGASNETGSSTRGTTLRSPPQCAGRAAPNC
jgi:nicotinamidase-related amidase